MKECVTLRRMSFLTTIIKTLAPLMPEPMLAWGAREYFNHRYKSIGTMTTLQIDPKSKSAMLDLELKGETQTLRVTIGRYEMTSEGDKTFIEIKEFETSREWINTLAGDLLKGRKFVVPAAIKAVL
jgi:hypothetical protein